VAIGRISGEMLEQNLNLTGNLTFNDDALTIVTDGKIGIKNTSPGVELDVTGTARANTLTVLGDLSMEWTMSMDAQDNLNFAYNSIDKIALSNAGKITANSLQSYRMQEYADIVATSSTSVTANISTTGTVVYMTADMTGDTTVNVRGDASTTLDDLLAVNESVTVVFLFTTGATAYINNIFQIDSVTQTTKWNGGSAPTAGKANAIDVYSYTIVKTAANTYTVLGSFSSFA
jgi:hypothetical protein